MKLEEQFYNSKISTNIFRREESISCVKIAEKFTIEFAQWMAKEYWLNSSGKYLQGQTHEELLEIFKKEKGL